MRRTGARQIGDSNIALLRYSPSPHIFDNVTGTGLPGPAPAGFPGGAARPEETLDDSQQAPPDHHPMDLVGAQHLQVARAE